MRACHVKGLYFYKHFAHKSAILDLSILFKANYPEIISRNKTLSSKFLCEEDKFLSISKQKKIGFAFPTKSLRTRVRFVLINPPFCEDTFLTDTRYRSPRSIPTNSMFPHQGHSTPTSHCHTRVETTSYLCNAIVNLEGSHPLT